jgi:hypothetical protein
MNIFSGYQSFFSTFYFCPFSFDPVPEGAEKGQKRKIIIMGQRNYNIQTENSDSHSDNWQATVYGL